MDIQTKDLLLLVLGVVIGIPPAVAISHYYFKKSFSKSLTPYLMFLASPMSGMAPEVRRNLQVEFKGRQVENLIEVQFLVVNNGSKALRDVIEPLTLRWAPGLRVLDAQVTSSLPEAMQVVTTLGPTADSPDKVTFAFPLLNASEWFIVKVVADGHSKAADWQWSVVADELPRVLKQKTLQLEDLGDIPTPKLDRRKAALVGLAFLCMAALWFAVGSPQLDALKKASAGNGLLGGTFANAAGLLLTVLAIGFAFIGVSLASVSMRGFRWRGGSLPTLPQTVVADLWRGHSAQVDAVARLKKSVKATD